jgi:tRNA1Val (adenine37-N6)-methyltransferase
MSGAGLEPKRLREVCPRPGAAPSLILAEGLRGGKPGLVIEPPLTLRDEKGEESAEVRRIYRRENEGMKK